uniref:Cytochrome P450 n=1 Tax=Fagus sylvatica TaxID=28930 RepID=A0A2N9HUW4_FAGSY
MAKKHGPLMHLRLGEVSTIVVSSPEIAREVMKTHDVIFASRPTSLAIKILTYDSTDLVFAPYGNYWRQLRKICTLELLSPKRVESYQPIREEELSTAINWIASKAGSTINLTEKIFTTAYGITSRAAFGKKCKDQEKFISIVKKMNEVAAEQKATEKKDEDARAEDLVDVLLKFHQEHSGDNEFSLTISNIKAVIMNIFTAGSETSATTVDWAMSEMIKNPRVMKKAQAEVREVFNRRGKVDETSINEMKYLKSIVKEILRLHAPVPLLIPRECGERCKLKGYEIPIKTKVIVNAWAIGRDPKHWTESEKFYPERFLDSSIDYKGTNFEYIPFGAGRRICPGITFGLANVELPLALYLYHFDWKLPNGMKNEDLNMTEAFGITVRRKDDLQLIPIAYHPLPVA